MEQIRNLSLNARIGIGAGLALLLIVIVYFIAFSGPNWVTVNTSDDQPQIDAWQKSLELGKITSRVDRTDNTYAIQVMSKDHTKAMLSIGGSGSRPKSDTAKACPVPGQLASSDVRRRADVCKTEAKIHDGIMELEGMLAARVTVSEDESDSLINSGKITKVTVQLYPHPDQVDDLDYSGFASSIANSVPGGSPDRVIITHMRTGKTLWANGRTGGESASGNSTACASSSEPVTDIIVKERMVNDCFESDLAKEIAKITGSEGYATIGVNVQLSPESKTRTISEVTRGALAEQSTANNSGGGTTSSTRDTSFQPGSSTTNSQTIAGYIQAMKISVLLDSKHVTVQQEEAVRDFLHGYILSERDPEPSVRTINFGSKVKATPVKSSSVDDPANGASGAPSSQTGTSDDNGSNGNDSSGFGNPGFDTGSSMNIPPALLAIGFLLLIGLVTIIALLWRRGARLGTERARFEDEFSKEQGVFANWAQSNPDALANDLAHLLGTPPAAARETAPTP